MKPRKQSEQRIRDPWPTFNGADWPDALPADKRLAWMGARIDWNEAQGGEAVTGVSGVDFIIDHMDELERTRHERQN